MQPCELNALIASITNALYTSLSRKDFLNLGIFLSLLSKTMLTMEALESLCKLEEKDQPPGPPH